MNLIHLRYFIELAETGHYTRAAQRLCITQPSLSHAIDQLEKELGVPLFEKRGRNTTLTRFGEQFLHTAQNTLKTLDEGTDALRLAARGEGLIRLGLLRSLGVRFLPELAERFLAAYPEKNIRFSFHSGMSHALLEGLTAGHFDMVFCSAPRHQPENDGLISLPVTRQRLVLIVPQDHPLAVQDSVDLKQTLEYPYLYFSEGSGLRSVVDGLFDAVGMKPQIACEVDEDQVIAGLVSCHFGVAIVPEMELLSHLPVKSIQIKSPSWERSLYMIRDSRFYTPPAAALFWQFVQEQTQSLPFLSEY